MENYRSQSTREGRNYQGQGGDSSSYYGSYGYGGSGSAAAPPSLQELRSYSTSYASSYVQPPQAQMDFDSKDSKLKKSKSRVASSSSKNWVFSDPELQRKKRVVSYKAYAVEGKMKGSLRKSFRWIKDVVHGLW